FSEFYYLQTEYKPESEHMAIEALEGVPSVRKTKIPPFNKKVIWLICLVAAMGGFLFGYDWVVVGGAKPFYEPYFNLVTPGEKGWGTSSALIGCIFGAL